MEINITTVIFTIINTLILYFFLKHLLFNPVVDFMNKRTGSIESDIKNAKEKLKNAEELKKEYENRITESIDEGRKIIEEHRKKALTLSDTIVGEAKEEANAIRERARVDVERERERLKDEIKRQIVELSILAASKAINEKLDDEEHHRLIENFINEVVV